MGLFGKKLFTKKKVKPETHLYDFHKWGGSRAFESEMYVELIDNVGQLQNKAESGKKAVKKEKPSRTPVEVHKLNMLNTPDRQVVCDEQYIVAEQEKLRKKLSLIKGDEGSSNYGRKEITSMIERLGNRRRYKEFLPTIDKFPYTTSEKVNAVVEAHANLRCGEASAFVPDFPDDAVEVMHEYRQMCQALCGKDPVFYVIADKKDFGETSRRRDPILLAQSPFGFIWQILGAWGEEMIYLGDL